MGRAIRNFEEKAARERAELEPKQEGRCNWPHHGRSNKWKRCKNPEGRCPHHKGPPPEPLL